MCEAILFIRLVIIRYAIRGKGMSVISMNYSVNVEYMIQGNNTRINITHGSIWLMHVFIELDFMPKEAVLKYKSCASEVRGA